jgi:CMP-N,N'-diacetyllegionaminic acid synthase
VNVLAYIPARGGSKGIPMKNLAPCAGKSLLQWTVECGRASELIDTTVVSSDDAEILRVGSRLGAECHMRNEEHSSDTSQIEDGLSAFLDIWDAGDNHQFDAIAILQPTSPQREGWQIDEAIQLLEHADSVVSVVSSHALKWARNGDTSPMYDIYARPRRQEMDSFYEENGAIYATTTKSFRATGVRSGGKVALYVMGEADRYQIDSPFDLAVVEGILEARHAAVS